MGVLNAMLLTALVKVLIETENPKLCAGIYSGMVLAMQLVALGIGAVTFLHAVIAVALGVGWSLGYFWILNRYEFGTGGWWAILIGGALLRVFL